METYLFLPRDSLGSGHRPVNIIGTSNIAAGYKLPKPKKVCRKSPSNKIIVHENFLSHDLEEESNNVKKLSSKFEFEQCTDKKICNRRIRTRAKQDVIDYEEKLRKRREKLKNMMLKEEAEILKEIKEEMQVSNIRRKEEMKIQTEEAKRREMENKKVEVIARRMQQYLASSPEVRHAISQRSTVDVKFSNLTQIEEKLAQKRTEKDMEELWHKFNMRELETERLREEEERRKRAEVNLGTVRDLKRQIAEKMAMQAEEMKEREKERKQFEKLLEKIQQNELHNTQRKRENRQKLKEDLEKQLEITKKRLAEHVEEEIAMDRAFSCAGQDELADRTALKKSSMSLRNELLAYMQSLKEFREQEAKREAEMDAMIRETAKDTEEKRNRAKAKEREAREREFHNVLKIRAEQLKEKEEAQKREKEQRDLENKMLEEQRQLEKRVTQYNIKLKREGALQYGRELMAQRDYIENIRKHERDEIEKMYKRGLEREKEYQNMIKKVLDSSVADTSAFKAQMATLKQHIHSEISKAGIISRCN